MGTDRNLLDERYRALPDDERVRLDDAVASLVEAKKRRQRVVAVITGEVHLSRGITLLVADLMRKGIVDAVLTTAVIIDHEMSGVLEKVKRIEKPPAGLHREGGSADGVMNVALLSPRMIERFRDEMDIDVSSYRAMLGAPGTITVEPAGGGTWPGGKRTALLSGFVLSQSRHCRIPFEEMAGYGADPGTMIGAGARAGLPVLVPPSCLDDDGGAVGLAIRESLSPSERSGRVAEIMNRAHLIITSTDGPGCTFPAGFTQGGPWGGGEAPPECSGRRTIVLIDGPLHDVPPTPGDHRAGEPESLIITGGLDTSWSLLAFRAAEALGITLDFVPCARGRDEGERLREWIAARIEPADKGMIERAAQKLIEK
ncbi:MAG: hypothetical protein JXO48_03725 [Deltaproteobacteria bacterium]|nr:hypothetical protein [Deltaproteobacteria bacterium]